MSSKPRQYTMVEITARIARDYFKLHYSTIALCLGENLCVWAAPLMVIAGNIPFNGGGQRQIAGSRPMPIQKEVHVSADMAGSDFVRL